MEYVLNSTTFKNLNLPETAYGVTVVYSLTNIHGASAMVKRESEKIEKFHARRQGSASPLPLIPMAG